MEQSQQRALSRRSLFKAAGAGAIAAGVVGPALAQGSRAPIDQTVSGPNVLAISCDEFFPVNGLGSSLTPNAQIAWSYSFWGGMIMTAGDSYWHAGFHLPAGSRITGMDLWVDPRNQADGITCAMMRYRAIDGTPRDVSGNYPSSFYEYICTPEATVSGVAAIAGVPMMGRATGNTVKEVSSPAINHLIDENNWNYRITWLRLTSGGGTIAAPFTSGAALFGVRIGYTAPAIVFPTTTTTTTTTTPTTTPPAAGASGPVFLSTPARVYDSRPGTAPATGPKTKFAAGEVRTISCAVGGVPTTARGVILNITATSTSANGGYATVFPSNSGLPATSNVNWNAGQTVANSVTVGCGPNAAVNVQVANSIADIILDVAGYYP